MPRVFVTSFATERFTSVQRDLNESALRVGLLNILSFSEDVLRKSVYYAQNKQILDEPCGAGYWAWKPYFILRALDAMDDGDVLFYCDSGSAFLSSPEPLVKIALEQPNGMVLFDARPLRNSQFTKRDCFVRLGCDKPSIWNANKVIATILVLRKCQSVLEFMAEWLIHCQDRAAITDDRNICGSEDLPEFLQHRWDQAILSVLAAKHSIETFRNPTHWGNFLKMPSFRVHGESVVSPYGLVPTITTYSNVSQENSPYGTIFEINRLPNMLHKKPLPTTGIPVNLSFRSKIIRKIKRMSSLA